VKHAGTDGHCNGCAGWWSPYFASRQPAARRRQARGSRGYAPERSRVRFVWSARGGVPRRGGTAWRYRAGCSLRLSPRCAGRATSKIPTGSPAATRHTMSHASDHKGSSLGEISRAACSRASCLVRQSVATSQTSERPATRPPRTGEAKIVMVKNIGVLSHERI
jgi:hypothetical protein